MGYRVLCFDMYGHGLSNAPKVGLWCCCRRGLPCGRRRGRYDLDFFVEQTADLIEHLGLANEPLNLVGFSLGGAVAVAFTKRYPDRVRRIAAMSPAGFLPRVPKEYYLLKATWCCLIPAASHVLCTCLYRKDRFEAKLKGEDPARIRSLWRQFTWSLFVKRGVASATLAMMLRVPWRGLAKMYAEVGSHPR